MEGNDLDLIVARALAHWRLIERALHDDGPWQMRYAGVTVPAQRYVMGHQVTFAADFPPLCPLGEPVISLLCAGEAVSAQTLEEPMDGTGGLVFWDLPIGDPVEVS